MKRYIILLLVVLFSLFAKAQIYVSPGTHLQIRGDVSIDDTLNNAGDVHVYNSANLYFADASGGGRYTAYYSFDAKKRYLVSSPLAGVSSRVFNRELGKLADNLWTYNAGWQLIQDSIALEPAMGYLSASNVYKCLALQGSVLDTVSIEIKSGLNILSSPYLCALDSVVFAPALKRTPGKMVHGKGFFFDNQSSAFTLEITPENRLKPANPVIDINDSIIAINGYLEINDTARGFLPPRTNPDSVHYAPDGVMVFDTLSNYLRVWNGNWSYLQKNSPKTDTTLTIQAGDTLILTISPAHRYFEAWQVSGDRLTKIRFFELRDLLITDNTQPPPFALASNERMLVFRNEEEMTVRIIEY